MLRKTLTMRTPVLSEPEARRRRGRREVQEPHSNSDREVQE